MNHKMKTPKTVAVIGAGLSGLACAHKLRDAGLDVTVLEKSRGVGGRMATRRTESGVTFDHGAQYFTVRDPAFNELIQKCCDAGTAALWQGRLVSLDRGQVSELSEPLNRYVGVPGMNAIAKSLAARLNVLLNVTVDSTDRSDLGWKLTDSSGTVRGPFDVVIHAIPPLQASKLINKHSALLARSIARVEMAPSWAVMLQVACPVPFDGAFVQNSSLNWVARNSSKPGRDSTDCWVLHATPAWSQTHLEDSVASVAKLLIDEFWVATGLASQHVSLVLAHRWRYALPREPLPERCLFDPTMCLGACGDWCGGPRVEGAYLSGIAMADAIIRLPAD